MTLKSTTKQLRTALSVWAAVLLAAPAAAGNILYVDDHAPPEGDGQTWDTAYRYLQDALAAAQPGSGIEEIHIGQGTYQPDQDEAGNVTPGDRDASFVLIDSVSLMGGYAGFGAPDPDERDIDLYETILTGDLLANDEPGFINYDENSYNVAILVDPGAEAALDGVTITSGNADKFIDHYCRGAGVWVRSGMLDVRGCLFTRNTAGAVGGAIAAVDGVVTISDCTIEQCKAVASGGGIAGIGTTELSVYRSTFQFNGPTEVGGAITTSSPVILLSECTFLSNVGLIAGAVDISTASTSVLVAECVFQDNTAVHRGGAMTLATSTSTQIVDCSFVNNSAWSNAKADTNDESVDYPLEPMGGAVHIKTGTHEFQRCTFTGNYVEENGGATYCDGDSLVSYTQCEFTENQADLGAAVYNTGDSVESYYTSCVFSRNEGGATYEYWSQFHFQDCVFESNTAYHGACIRSFDSDIAASIVGCDFRANWVSGTGGALHLAGSSAIIVFGCDFVSNTAENVGGGAVFYNDARQIVGNCRFLGNHTGGDGGAVLGSGHHYPPSFINCLFSGNTAADRGGALFMANGRSTLTNCTVVNNSALSKGGGVFGRYGAEWLIHNSVVWSNSVNQVYDEEAQIHIQENSTVEVAYSCVMDWTGGYGGWGNMGLDPLFADPLGPDGVAGTEDDDLHLNPGSPCIDAGNNNLVPQNRDDIVGDGMTCLRFPADLDGEPRFSDDPQVENSGCGQPVMVDMGVFESAGDASVIVYGDVNNDGVVDINDLFGVLHDWGPCEGCCVVDVNGDFAVDIDDVMEVLGNWGPCL